MCTNREEVCDMFEILQKHAAGDHTYRGHVRHQVQMTRKMGCPSKVNVKEIVRFPNSAKSMIRRQEHILNAGSTLSTFPTGSICSTCGYPRLALLKFVSLTTVAPMWM